MKINILVVCAIGAILGGVCVFVFTHREEHEFQLAPRPAPSWAVVDGAAVGTHVGTGWSMNASPQEAAKEDVAMAGRELFAAKRSPRRFSTDSVPWLVSSMSIVTARQMTMRPM